MVRILKISPQFCRISEFGSIKIREFATRIVAQRQEVTRRNGVRTLFFQRWELQIPDFFSAKITNSAERRYLREC